MSQYGWKDIKISTELIGEKINKGTKSWLREYYYVSMPIGYGYDNYCFLLSANCVEYSRKGKYSSILINSGMNIELFYEPDKREPGKRYKRHKMCGNELIEKIFEAYENDIQEKERIKLEKEKIAKEKREKKTKGSIVCGMYTGNIYGNFENGYTSEDIYRVYFKSDAGTYRNKKFSKVQNVRFGFTIIEDVSLYFFNKYEDILNDLVLDYDLFRKGLYTIENRLINKNISPVVNEVSGKIMEEYHANCNKTIEEIKKAIMEYTKERSKEDKELK